MSKIIYATENRNSVSTEVILSAPRFTYTASLLFDNFGEYLTFPQFLALNERPLVYTDKLFFLEAKAPSMNDGYPRYTGRSLKTIYVKFSLYGNIFFHHWPRYSYHGATGAPYFLSNHDLAKEKHTVVFSVVVPQLQVVPMIKTIKSFNSSSPNYVTADIERIKKLVGITRQRFDYGNSWKYLDSSGFEFWYDHDFLQLPTSRIQRNIFNMVVKMLLNSGVKIVKKNAAEMQSLVSKPMRTFRSISELQRVKEEIAGLSVNMLGDGKS